jgi:hypothetical protein
VKPIFYICFFLIPACSVFTQIPQNGIKQANAVLYAADISGIEIRSCASFDWKYTNDNGAVVSNPGLVQSAVLDDVEVRIFYSEFSSAGLALKGIGSHIKGASAAFAEGVWEGAETVKIGDSAWHGGDGDTVGILVLSGSVCFRVDCRGGNQASRRNLCMQTALVTAGKIERGAKVEMPVETQKDADAEGARKQTGMDVPPVFIKFHRAIRNRFSGTAGGV